MQKVANKKYEFNLLQAQTAVSKRFLVSMSGSQRKFAATSSTPSDTIIA